MAERKVQCPACKGQAFIRINKYGDPYFTCPVCRNWNGYGVKYRDWCNSLPTIGESAAPPPEVPKAAPKKPPVKVAPKVEPVTETPPKKRGLDLDGW